MGVSSFLIALKLVAKIITKLHLVLYGVLKYCFCSSDVRCCESKGSLCLIQPMWFSSSSSFSKLVFHCLGLILSTLVFSTVFLHCASVTFRLSLKSMLGFFYVMHEHFVNCMFSCAV